MVKVTTDIDIDFPDRNLALTDIMHIPASMEQKGQPSRHPTGVYFQNVPIDPLTGLSALNYEDASDHGYFKVDFLNNTIYDGVRDEEHLVSLMEEPDWEMFEVEEIVSMLAHIHSSFGIVKAIRPTCVEDLAVVLALMRPGKRHLMSKSRSEIDSEIWKSGSDGYQFRRSHAIAYAVSIIVQLNIICEKTALELDMAAL